MSLFYHRYLIPVIFFLVCSGLAFAGERAVDCPQTLTAEQCNKLEADVLKMAKENGPFGVTTTALPTPVDLEQTKEYLGLGKEIGQAIGATAKELGIAVNDFAKTDVGVWTFWIIMFYVFGNTIQHYLAVVFLMTVGIPFWFTVRNHIYGVKITRTTTGSGITQQTVKVREFEDRGLGDTDYIARFLINIIGGLMIFVSFLVLL